MPARRLYAGTGITVDGERDIPGIWAVDGTEDARPWLRLLAQLKNRGVDVVLISLWGSGGVARGDHHGVWERTIVQWRVAHLIRNPVRHAGRQRRDRIAKALKPVYTAPVRGSREEAVHRARRGVEQTPPDDREAAGKPLG